MENVKVDATKVLLHLWPLWLAQLIFLGAFGWGIMLITKNFSNEVHAVIGFYAWLVMGFLVNGSSILYVLNDVNVMKKYGLTTADPSRADK